MSGRPDIPATERRPAEGRRWVRTAAMQAVLSVALAAALVGMLHHLAFRHYARADLSGDPFFRLSDKTRSLLATLTNRVDVTVLFQPGEEMYDVLTLLREYAYACPRIHVARVDPDRDVTRVKELAQTYPVTEANVVIFDCEGRHRIVGADDLADFDRVITSNGLRRVRRAFRGEQAFSSALLEVAHARTPVVYFLAGHGERALDSFERGQGLAQLARLLRQENIEARPLLLGEDKGVPDDAAALVIAGPQRPIPQPELDLIARYLDRNGRAVILLDSRTSPGLETVLQRWDVRVGDDVVQDALRFPNGGLVFSRFGRHAITENLHDLATVLFLPRSIEPAAVPAVGGVVPADRPRVVRLMLTSERGWAETDLVSKPAKYDPALDRAGPVAVAVAVERGPLPGIDVQIRPTRLVVLGDSNFIANGGLVSGNGDLFLGALNWVLDREDLIAIAPKPLRETHLTMDRSRLRALGWTVIGGLPALVALAGVAVWWRRRE